MERKIVYPVPWDDLSIPKSTLTIGNYTIILPSDPGDEIKDYYVNLKYKASDLEKEVEQLRDELARAQASIEQLRHSADYNRQCFYEKCDAYNKLEQEFSDYRAKYVKLTRDEYDAQMLKMFSRWRV